VKKDKQDRKVIFRRVRGHIIPITVGAAAAGAVAYNQRDRLTGKRTAFHSAQNGLHEFIKDHKINNKTATKDKAVYNNFIKQHGVMIPPLENRKYFANPKEKNFRGRVIMKHDLMKGEPGKPVLFAATRKLKGAFTGNRFKIRMGEKEFQKNFIKEKTFEPLDDNYHRKLKREYYVEKEWKEPIVRERYKKDILGGIKYHSKEIKDHIFSREPFTFKRKFFIKNIWKVKNLTTKQKFQRIGSELKWAAEHLNPLNPSYEHAFFTFKKISPRKIVGSPRFREPKFKLINIAANPKRFLLGLGLTAGAGTASYLTANKIQDKFIKKEK
jgi:hypothetical protein